MAAIGKIRNQGKLLAFVIGGALVLFIAGSGWESIRSTRDLCAGEVMGEEINIQMYQQEVQEELQRNRRNNPQITDADRERIENDVWNRLTMTKVIASQRKALGVDVTPQEIFDITSINPDPAIKGAFTDPATGQFNASAMGDFVANLDRATDEQRSQWLDIEKYLEQKMTNDKYNNLFSKSVYTPTWEAENFYNNRFKKLTSKYVFFDFAEIADDEVTVTDQEILNYIRENAAKYKQEIETRKVDYIAYDIIPSNQDSAEVITRLNELYADFQSTEEDSLFVALNSDRGFDKAYKVAADINADIENKDAIFNSKEGDIYGPYLDGVSYVLAKVVDRKKIADSVKCRHILLKPKQNDTRETFFARRDSVMDALDDGTAFSALARTYSDDQGSAIKGGDLGWAKPGQMVKPFNDKIFFEGDKGEILTCNSQFGFHIIDVLKYKATTEAVQVGYIYSELSPSDFTTDSVFRNASNFYAQSGNEELFRANAEKEGRDIKSTRDLEPNTGVLPGLGNAREMVKWAYSNDKGAVSSIMLVDDQYIVAVLAGVGEIGLKDIEEVRSEVEFKIRQEKKGQKLIEKYKDALAAGAIEEIAKMAEKELGTLTEINFENPYSREIGRDLIVAGTCFGTPEGEVSKPVIGNKGVYVVKPEFHVDAPQVSDYNEYKDKVANNLKSRTEYAIITALREMAEIRDYRYKY